jgi:NH3-dependent NAD+ synthetase
MRFWDLWKTEEKKVRLKDFTVTYYEINQILNRVEKEYNELYSSKRAVEKKVGRIGLMELKKIRRNFKEFIKKKYNYTE